MEHTEEQKRQLVADFAARRKRQLLALIPVVAALLLLFASENRSEPLFGLPASAWGPIGFAVIVGVLLFSLYNWRCPACNKYLGKGFAPRYCPRCGVGLSSGS